MVQGFFRGIRASTLDNVPRSVRVVPSAAIFLVGSAPIHLVDVANRRINDPVRVLSDRDDSLWAGPRTPGFTIPEALNAIRLNAGGLVDFVNVFNPATHRTTVTTASNVTQAFATNHTLQLNTVTGVSPSQVRTAQAATGIETLVVSHSSGTPTYALTTDYTFNANTGVVTRVLGGAITAGQTVRVSYTYADPTRVLPADIIGAVVAGDRTGLQEALGLYSSRGYTPKVIICPGFSDLSTVAAEMVSIASRLRAIALIDAPLGVLRDEAIAGRGGTAPAANFNFSSQHAMLLYPRLLASDNTLQPYSSYMAGVISRTDAELGYWWSPSNKELRGVIGVERVLTADISDQNSDMNALNAVGITSVANNFGEGFRTAGNRTSLFPSDGSPVNFIPVARTLGVFHESLVRASVPFLDRPINQALIEAIEASGNGFVREQIVLGALLPGSRLFYRPELNLPTAIAAGRLTFSIVMMIPTPAENIQFETTLDINLFTSLRSTVEG